MSNRELELTFVATLQDEASTPPHHTARAALGLMRNGRTLKRLAEALCNGTVSQEEYEAKSGGPRRRVLATCKLLHLKGAQFGGDPRGCVVKLKLPSGKTDDFGAEGFCVPGA